MKTYVAGGVYHIYNRGVEKRTIFETSEDYAVFAHYLGSYLRPPSPPDGEALPRGLALAGCSYDLHKRVCLLAYCLMPNHFHLLLRQEDERAMSELMRRLSNAYVGYFNQKYGRVGTLYQGRYRAVLVDRTELLLHLSRYIHRNPADILAHTGVSSLDRCPFSSYPDYVGNRATPWLKPAIVLEQFGTTPTEMKNSYRAYVEDESVDDASISKHRLD